MNSQGFFLTASILPSSNIKEPLSEKNLPADNSGYDVTDGPADSAHYFHLKRDTMLNNLESELVSRFNKTAVPTVEENGVLRIRKDKVANHSNRENTQQRPPNKQKVSKPSTPLIKRKNTAEKNSSATTNQKPTEAPEAKRKAIRTCIFEQSVSF